MVVMSDNNLDQWTDVREAEKTEKTLVSLRALWRVDWLDKSYLRLLEKRNRNKRVRKMQGLHGIYFSSFTSLNIGRKFNYHNPHSITPTVIT